jgi:translation initiation factor RLI1
LAVLVAAPIPRIPHPVTLLTGEQGTGKSTATARLASIIDPSLAQLRKPPRDVEQWTTARGFNRPLHQPWSL